MLPISVNRRDRGGSGRLGKSLKLLVTKIMGGILSKNVSGRGANRHDQITCEIFILDSIRTTEDNTRIVDKKPVLRLCPFAEDK
jgi:hypothetical protein